MPVENFPNRRSSAAKRAQKSLDEHRARMRIDM